MKIFLKGDRINEGDIIKDFGKVIRTTGGYEREISYPNPTSFVAFIKIPENNNISLEELSAELSARAQKLDEICKALSQFFDQSIILASTDTEECVIKMLHSWGHQILITYGNEWKIRSIQPQLITVLENPVKDIMNLLFTEAIRFRGGF